MAARVLLICIACSVGLIAGKTIGLQLGVDEGGGEIVGVRSRRVTLPCTPTHPANVEWTQDGKPLVADKRKYVAENGSLIITKLVHKKKGESDAGVYRCKVKNASGAIISSPTKLTIAGMGHEFIESPGNVSIGEGDLLRLLCLIESNPPATIEWIKDGKPLPHNKRYMTPTSEALFITNVKTEDQGRYKCQAVNGITKKSRFSDEGEVVVRQTVPGPAKFLSSVPPGPLILRHGDKGSILCAASGLPRPTLRWIHTKTDGTNSTLQTTTNGLNIFHISKVTNSHSGTYTCIATQNNKERVTSTSQVVRVEVDTPPVIEEKPKSQTFPTAKTVRFDCDAKGHPKPNVTWYKDGIKLHINGRIKQKAKELVLGGVVAQDTGVYQCFAVSRAGVAWSAGRLLVNTSTDQPAPPTGLTCETLSPTSVNLSWVQQKQTDLKVFTVHYFPTDGGDEGKEVAPNDTFVVDKLQPFTNYTFYVRTYSGKSASEQSHRIVCKTGEAVPTAGPQVSVIPSSPHCLLVTWSHPPATQARGAITTYKVQWKRANQTSINFDLVPGTMTQYRIRGLVNGCEYLVRVIGATALGWPELSDDQAPWFKVVTPSVSSPMPPPSVHLTPLNSTSLLVEWKFHGKLTPDGFRVSYKNVLLAETQNLNFTSTTNSTIITNLEPSSYYEITVNAFTGETEGEVCSETILMNPITSPTLPSPVSLDAVPLSQNLINVTWSLPFKRVSNNVTHFTVFYNPFSEPTQKMTVTNISDDWVLISGLKANTVYEFWVVGLGSNNQTSPASTKLECRTLADVIQVVDDVKWTVLNKTSVDVSWKPLSTPVTRYTVFYTRDETTPINIWHQESVDSNTTSIKLTSLTANLKYALRVRGESGSTAGPLSPATYITLSSPTMAPLPPYSSPEINSDQFLGIIVGCGISVCCIALCSVSLLYRRRCSKLQSRETAPSNCQSSTQHELQSLTHIENKTGGYVNGQMNGLKLSLIGNGVLPNGSSRDKVVRITENPQRGEMECGSSRTTDEGDSLLSGPELELEPDETHITYVADSTLEVKDTPPDDGFHETHPVQHW